MTIALEDATHHSHLILEADEKPEVMSVGRKAIEIGGKKAQNLLQRIDKLGRTGKIAAPWGVQYVNVNQLRTASSGR